MPLFSPISYAPSRRATRSKMLALGSGRRAHDVPIANADKDEAPRDKRGGIFVKMLPPQGFAQERRPAHKVAGLHKKDERGKPP